MELQNGSEGGRGLAWTLPNFLLLILQLQYYFNLAFRSNLCLWELEHHTLVFTFFTA